MLEKPIQVYVCGVSEVGKTSLCRQIASTTFHVTHTSLSKRKLEEAKRRGYGSSLKELDQEKSREINDLVVGQHLEESENRIYLIDGHMTSRISDNGFVRTFPERYARDMDLLVLIGAELPYVIRRRNNVDYGGPKDFRAVTQEQGWEASEAVRISQNYEIPLISFDNSSAGISLNARNLKQRMENLLGVDLVTRTKVIA